MWRRAASLSPLASRSKPSKLCQEACTFKVWESFSSESEIPTPSKVAPYITFVLGGPGSGKGTQCAKIVEAFGFTHVSAGDLLRREIASNSAYGSVILGTIREGKIVPSQVTVQLIQKEMESSDNDKFLIDGFPRSEQNREAFERIIGTEPNVVLFFDCPEQEMVKRVLNRNQGRVDDNIETIKKRLEIFDELNWPVINHYSKTGKLHKINAVGTVDDIFEKVRPIFAALRYILLFPISCFQCSSSSIFNVLDNLEGRAGFCMECAYLGYAELGLYEDAMALYFQMEEEGIEPDRFTFPQVLKAFGELGSFRLVGMYAKRGNIVKARKVFYKVANRDKISWYTTLTILAAVPSLELVVQIHRWVVRHGVEWNLSVANALIAAYSKHHELNRARRLFSHMPERDVVTWDTIISAHSKSREALLYFDQMEKDGALPDNTTFVSILSACANLGLRVFDLELDNEYNFELLMKVYGNVGRLEDAEREIDDGG
ncbi:hypothetical protein C1H46_015743 [Malus baccata]|uniref:UMP-CMP kinase n=1 Tax=Malus baccata TaxID=106549 RepID=A0A540MI80_MALBA|nr:hypothetical protein C1H46_015743 [Malus baccata]